MTDKPNKLLPFTNNNIAEKPKFVKRKKQLQNSTKPVTMKALTKSKKDLKQMVKKILAICLAVLMGCLAGCSQQQFTELSSSAITVTPAVKEEPKVLYANPLTGIAELQEDELNKRPVAIMVNNISTAQKVQCGLNDADLVFECLVEGGISRLMAVYYDLPKAGQVGSIRSSRYTYVELARWLDAVYVHHGSDMVYTDPYMKSFGMDHFEVSNSSGFRESNGLAWEHTLYTTGEKLYRALEDRAWRLNAKEEKYPLVFSFGKEDAPVTPATPCNSITYAMSGSNKTTFAYDAQTKQYVRKPSGETHKDYKSGDVTATDNVFVLFANSPMFEDGYHLKTTLSSGKGYYVSHGGCQEIQWKKGSATDPLIFTDSQGKELTVNPGRSWIAFASAALKGKTVVE